MRFELQPYNRDATDEELLADLRAVASKLSVQSLTQSEYDKHGRFCAATLKKRFGWNAALIKAGLVPSKLMNVTADELILDIQRVAALLDTTKLTWTQYKQHGKYSQAVVYRHFDRSWKNAIKAAKLEPGWNYAISNEDLFDNLERVWRHIGRQPTVDEMNPPLSRYSHATYANRFKGYRKALEAFVASINEPSPPLEAADAGPAPATDRPMAPPPKPRTPRTVNYRLRFLTLRRDGSSCRLCGAKPPAVELEIDHIIPWSKGGETILENLQILCARCNGGKSNLPFEDAPSV